MSDDWPNNEAGWLEGLDDRTQQERRDGLREKYEPRAWTCPGCGWHTESVEHEQHTCPTPLDAVPNVPPDPPSDRRAST